MKAIAVWDLPTRLFHWLLALCVSANLIIDPRGEWFPIHVAAGCTALGLALFRIAWGFIGSCRSLFIDFVRSPRVVLRELQAALRLRLERHIGHNPLGGSMVVVLLAMTLATAATGLFSGTREGLGGPFVDLIGGRGLRELHGTLGNLMIFLVILHLCGVALHYLVTRENIVGSMITGRKRLDAAAAGAEPALVSTWRAVIPAALAVALGAWLWWHAHLAPGDALGMAPSPPVAAETSD